MATEVRISGTTYKAADDFIIKQQAGAVSISTVSVLKGSNPIPQPLQSAQILIDGAPVFYGLIASVQDPRRSTGYEPARYTLDIQSIETILNFRMAKRNWYNKRVDEIVTDIFNDYLAEEGLTLGGISTTTVQIGAYRKTHAKISEILDELADKVDGASYYIAPNKKFYFLVRDEFPAIEAPDRVANMSRSRSYGDLRTVQTVKGASAGILATWTNTALKAAIAALSGTSGKIEAIRDDSTIRNPTAAAMEAADTGARHAENEQTIRCEVEGIAGTDLYTLWNIAPSRTVEGETVPTKWPAEYEGEYVVIERTITGAGGKIQTSLTLRNRNYFARYGYTVRGIAAGNALNNERLGEEYSPDRLTPTKKISTRREFLAAGDAVTALDAQADALGITTEKETFDTAFQALGTYLNGGDPWDGIATPAWLAEEAMTFTEEIDGAEYDAAWSAYFAAKTALETAIAQAKEAAIIEQAGQDVPNWLPRYHGPLEYPATPTTPRENDLFLCYSTTPGDEYRSMKKYTDAGGTLVWTRTVDPTDLEPGIRDIADISNIRDDSGTRIYGLPEEYGVAETAIAHIKLALINTLKADEVEVRGTIKGERGIFKGQIEAPPIKTEAAQVPGIITPAATHWKGEQFSYHIASLADGLHSASGTFDGKAVDAVIKGAGHNYYLNSTPGSLYGWDWQTADTVVAQLSGDVALAFEMSIQTAGNTAYGRILKNGIEIFSAQTGTNIPSYQAFSKTEYIRKGDVIVFQFKASRFLWISYDTHYRNLKIASIAGTCGIRYTDGEHFFITPSLYYTAEGAVTIPPLAEYNFGWMKGYFIGTALQTALQSAGGSIWQRNDLEPNKWSETYGAPITNYFSGKACTAYEIQDTGVVLYNVDGTTTKIYYGTMYAYSAENKLYPAARNARFSVGGYRHETGAPIPIQRIENTNPMEDTSHFSVISLNSPEHNHDPLAKYESTWAKTIKWFYNLYHEFVSDDSFHNLVEENLSETIAHDATLKRFTRLSGNFHTFLDDATEFKVEGYSGAYIGNNGIYKGLDVHTLWVGYTTFEGATPVTAPAMGGIKIGKETFAGSTTKISIDATAKTITRSAGTFSRSLIGPGEYLELYGLASANNGFYRIVEMVSSTVLRYDVTMGNTPVTVANAAGGLIRYPTRHVHAILNFGDSTRELHKPRVQWGYQKGSGAYEFGMEYSHATRRGYLPNGRRRGGNIHANTTSGALFTTLNAALMYTGEDLLPHGAIKFVVGVQGPPGEWTYYDHVLIPSSVVKISASVIRIYGLDGTALGQYDATSGSTEAVTVSISW